MGYCLKRGRRLGDELRRLYEEQLGAALDALSTAARRRGTGGVHACRKHVKKARVLLDVIGFKVDVADAQRELKTANRALGALSDAYRAVKVAAHLKDLDLARSSIATLDRLRLSQIARVDLLERHSRARGERARVARLLRSARGRAARWRIDAVDTAAFLRAMARARQRSRRAARLAERHRGVETYHLWRRRVKADWYLHRLAADHAGGRLIDDQHRLAALDACLGRLHDTAMLAAVVAAEDLLPRHESAQLLVVLRQVSRDLRRRAGMLAVALDDGPRDLRRRVSALWHLPVLAASEVSSCRPAA